ncbi:MAG: nicotinamide riboside transporter PnuC [Bacteroidales bacterium]
MSDWLLNHWIEIFGVASGIIYVILEIRQKLWLWPVGIITSAVYIWIFFTGKLYADMSLQVYYLVISCVGWYWWIRGAGRRGEGERGGRGEGETEGRREEETKGMRVTRLKLRTGLTLGGVFIVIYTGIWLFLTRLTDSPVPVWDAFITSMSVVATWMLARKIYEHWFLWLIVNSVSVLLFIIKGLYPTVILYMIYFLMSFAGLKEWKKSMILDSSAELKN